MHPLLLAPLVLEPDLDDPHAQARVLGQLLSHQSCGLWIIVEDILQHFKLLGGNIGSWTPPLATGLISSQNQNPFIQCQEAPPFTFCVLFPLSNRRVSTILFSQMQRTVILLSMNKEN